METASRPAPASMPKQRLQPRVIRLHGLPVHAITEAQAINAILDALAPLGVDDISMPATPAKVWQAIQNA